MMDTTIRALEQIAATGAALFSADELDPPALQHWLKQRQQAFSQIEHAKNRWSDEERRAAHSLGEKILELDGRLLSKFEARLNHLGEEIVTSRKLSNFADSRERRYPAQFIRRAI